MRTFLPITVTILALGAAGPARATTFDFTDTLSSSEVVTGSFDGTANGNLITGLSNISVYINGTAFNNNGSLYDAYYDQNSWVDGAAVVSFDGAQNNFVFTDVQNVTNNTEHYYDVQGYGALASNSNTNQFFQDSTGGTWSVSAVSGTTPTDPESPPTDPEPPPTIPEPASMLLLGGGLMGLGLMRRKA